MRINKAFQKVAGGRIIGFHAEYAKIFDVCAGLLLSQAAYYENSISAAEKKALAPKNENGVRTGKTKLFYWHTDAQWMGETGLREYQLRLAKRVLELNGVLEVELYGRQAQNHYRVDFTQLERLLNNPELVKQYKQRQRDPKRFDVFKAAPAGDMHETKVGDMHETSLETCTELCSVTSTEHIYKKTDKEKEEECAEALASQNSENEISPDDQPDSNSQGLVDASSDSDAESGKKKKRTKTSLQGKRQPSVEEAAVRREINRFLADKCFHARDEARLAMLLDKQHAQLGVAAEELQKRGATLEQVQAWWQWFLSGGDFRGGNVADAAKEGRKINTAPSLVVETWLAFLGSAPVSESGGGSYNMADDFGFSADRDAEPALSFDMLVPAVFMEGKATYEEYNVLKNDFLGDNPTAEKLQEIEKYERSYQYNQYVAA